VRALGVEVRRDFAAVPTHNTREGLSIGTGTELAVVFDEVQVLIVYKV
jgi:hypothetical protein